MIRQHHHLIIRGLCNNPPTDKTYIENWMIGVTKASNMNILSGPFTAYVPDNFNKGWTGIAIIEFSHIALHIWEDESLIEFDMFSCKEFSLDDIMNEVKKFDPYKLSIQFIDRDSNFGDEKKFYVVYKTTNLINNKFYFGVHGSKYIDMSYIGSGKIIEQAIKKYGKKNFKVELLKFFFNEDDAYEYEKEIITEDFIKSKNCYNSKSGGKEKTIEHLVWITNKEEDKMVTKDVAVENYIGFGWEFGRTFNNIKC